MKEKTPVQIRKKKLANGGYSLILDTYLHGIRKRKTLGLYLNPGNSPLVKAKNKATMEAAKTIQAKELTNLQANKAGYLSDSQQGATVRDILDIYLRDRPSMGESGKATARKVVDYWEKFAGPRFKVADITPHTVLEFVRFLQKVKEGRSTKADVYNRKRLLEAGIKSDKEISEIVLNLKGKMSQREIAKYTGLGRTVVDRVFKEEGKKTQRKSKPLSDSTIANYFETLGTLLNKAVIEGVILVSPYKKIDMKLKPERSSREREYLTKEELEKLVSTPCRNDLVKMVFLFACFTGLRISDIKNVTWAMVDQGRISEAMIKTGKWVSVPLSENAMKWLPERGNASPEDKIYNGLPAKSTINLILRKWMLDAGVNKYISFHCSRHTFATLLITYGCDLYTVSKLLGHTNILVTQVYAKLVEDKKVEAINSIPTI